MNNGANREPVQLAFDIPLPMRNTSLTSRIILHYIIFNVYLLNRYTRVNKISKYLYQAFTYFASDSVVLAAVINIKLLTPAPPFPQGCIAVNYWYDMEFDTKYNYFNLLANLKNVASL